MVKDLQLLDSVLDSSKRLGNSVILHKRSLRKLWCISGGFSFLTHFGHDIHCMDHYLIRGIPLNMPPPHPPYEHAPPLLGRGLRTRGGHVHRIGRRPAKNRILGDFLWTCPPPPPPVRSGSENKGGGMFNGIPLIVNPAVYLVLNCAGSDLIHTLTWDQSWKINAIFCQELNVSSMDLN